MKRKDYNKYSDKMLCELISDSDEQALRELLDRHHSFIRLKANEFRDWIGRACITYDELIIEGETGLYEAAIGFEADRGYTFLTFAGRVIQNRMKDLIHEFYRPLESSLSAILDEEEDNISPLAGMLFIDAKNMVEPQVIKKVFFEQFRECFLNLSERQRWILMYKFGYDPQKPVLTCAGRELPDSKVAEHFLSKTSLISRNKWEAFEQLKKGLYGEQKRSY